MRRLARAWPAIVGLALLAVAAGLIWKKLHPPSLPSNLIESVGRIDGDLVNLGVKYPGRLREVLVEDGQPIHRGQLVARLESREFEAKLQAAKAQLRAQKALLAAKDTELSIARQSIPLALERAQAQLQKTTAQRAILLHRIDSLKGLVAQDERDFRRSENLYERHLLQQESYEKARLKLRTDRNTLQAAQGRRQEVEAAYTVAQAAMKQAQADQKRLEAMREEVAAMQAGVAAAQAAVEEARSALSDLELHSPLRGFVVERVAQPGEVLASGSVVATLIDPRTLYLKIYIDTIENGRIKIGDRAEIFLDAAPDHPIPARVVRIAQQAEFTPKEVNVRSDRIQRVFAVHLKPLRLDPRLKLGLPALGVVTTDGKGLPASMRELPPL